MRALNTASGLKGLSGVSNDMRKVHEARLAGNARAQLAVDAFADNVLGYVGMFAAYLNGLDALVFTGGIGENSAMVRARVCQALAHLGLEMDAAKNTGGQERRISRDGSPVEVWVIPANEEINVARRVVALLGQR